MPLCFSHGGNGAESRDETHNGAPERLRKPSADHDRFQRQPSRCPKGGPDRARVLELEPGEAHLRRNPADISLVTNIARRARDDESSGNACRLAPMKGENIVTLLRQFLMPCGRSATRPLLPAIRSKSEGFYWAGYFLDKVFTTIHGNSPK